MNEGRSAFAEWLSATMQSRNMSQAEVAREVGVADAQVSRWRRGQVTPSVRYLQQLATSFDVPRVQLERMAGYPVAEAGEDVDPELAAEIEAHGARLRRLMEEQLAPELWQTYVDACEALADRLRSSFQEIAEAAEEEVERTHHGSMGFRT
jgi:transcriptional regulator with XRE-family HTH domain